MGSSVAASSKAPEAVVEESAIRRYKMAGLLYIAIGTSVFTYQGVAHTSMIAMITSVIVVPCGIWMVMHADKLMVRSLRAEFRRNSPGLTRDDIQA